MPNKKITAFNNNNNPTLSDVFPIVNSGETKQMSLSGLTNFVKPMLAFTGGTVSGATNFTSSLSASTISANTVNSFTNISKLMNLAVVLAPSVPNDGDIWLQSNDVTGLKIRLSGVTKTITIS